MGSTFNKLQHTLFQLFPIQKNVLYSILKVIRNPSRGKHRNYVNIEIAVMNIIIT